MDLKTKLKTEPCYGIFSKTTDSAMVEALGMGGLDFIILDREHGPAEWETLHNHIRAARISGMAPVVRVEGVNAHAISAALDAGAEGIQVPGIGDASQAQAVIEAARFYPKGRRGLCRFVRAASYGGTPKDQYLESANESLVILQIEGTEGVENLDEILAVEGVDIIFVGPYDLSQSVGRPGEIDAPSVRKLIASVIDRARVKGVMLGTFCDVEGRIPDLCREGFSYIAYSVDLNILQNRIRQIVGERG